jgi:acetolactate decarboxylase
MKRKRVSKMRDHTDSLHRNAARIVSTLLLALALAASGCASPRGGVVYQNATIDALLDGNYDGDVTMAQLLRHGDFGLGTFDHLDGEMLVLRGRVFQVRSDGRAYIVLGHERTPFAAVTFFHPDEMLAIGADSGSAIDYAALQKKLDFMRPADGHAYAFLIHGRFATMRTRSVPRQEPPYRRLIDVVKQQPVFELKECNGTLVGFWFPESMRHLNVPGYHFHFLTDDQSAGGHVLDLSVRDAEVRMQSLSTIRMDLSRRAPKIPSPATRSSELEQVEK